MLEKLEKQYDPQEKTPLGYYALATLVFNGLLLTAIRIKQRDQEDKPSNSKDPYYVELRDLVLTGVATHKLARMITKDEITSFIRAPFTRYQESLGYGEVNESVRTVGGAEQVLGELLSCNYCMSVWVGLGFLWGMKTYPRETRALATFFSAVTLSDFLHVAYEEKRTRANVLTLREEKMDKINKLSA